MKKILTVQESIKKARLLRRSGKHIVLVGGCFDILHVGHIIFLESAKKGGDVLFVLLESDEAVKVIKGKNRPINSQKDRAQVLSALTVVDYVICLPKKLADHDYDQLLIKLKPDILATTKGDSHRHHKERQAKLVGAKLIDVTNRLKDQSTTRLAKILQEDL